MVILGLILNNNKPKTEILLDLFFKNCNTSHENDMQYFF